MHLWTDVRAGAGCIETLPEFLLEIVRDGGLIPNLKKRLAKK